jgi:glutathione S-transferase
MITVHHLNNSRSQRVLWALEELGVPYDIERYERDPKTMLAPKALRAVHPLGKSPVIVDDVDGGRTLAESGAILEYLVATYGKGALQPPASDASAQLQYRYWMHYAEGSAMPPLLMKLVFDRIEHAPLPFFVKPFAKLIARKAKSSFVMPQIQLHLGFMESALGKSGWFAGDELTAADIQMSFPLEAAAARGGLGPSYPRLSDFLTRIHARPAYRRALERGGPYGLAH